MAIGQPVWSRVDEAAHYDVIAQYAAGVYPHDSVTTIRPETLEVMQRTGVYGFVVDNSYQHPDPGFQAMPSGLTDAQHVLWIRRHGWQYSYEAFQPPLYYALALPAWEVGDALGGALGALYAVRIFGALLAALLAPLAMLIALRLSPATPGAGWGAAVLTAAMPGVDANLTSVTNDVLVAVLGAVALVVAIGGRPTLRRAALLGLLLGAAMREGSVFPEAQVRLPLRTMNRHGLISGATGTGKTKTLAMMAEQLSEAGVPTFKTYLREDLERRRKASEA